MDAHAMHALDEELFACASVDSDNEMPPPPPAAAASAAAAEEPQRMRGHTQLRGAACQRWTTYHNHTLGQLDVLGDPTSYSMTECLLLLSDAASAGVSTQGARSHLAARIERSIVTSHAACLRPGATSSILCLLQRWRKGEGVQPLLLLDIYTLHREQGLSAIAMHARAYYAQACMDQSVRLPDVMDGQLRALFHAKDDSGVKLLVRRFHGLLLAHDPHALAGLFEVLRMAAAKGERPERSAAAAAAASVNKQNPKKGDISRRKIKLKVCKIPALYPCGQHLGHYSFDFLLWEVVLLVARQLDHAIVKRFVGDMWLVYSSPDAHRNPDRELTLVHAVLCIVLAKQRALNTTGKRAMHSYVNLDCSHRVLLELVNPSMKGWSKARKAHRQLEPQELQHAPHASTFQPDVIMVPVMSEWAAAYHAAEEAAAAAVVVKPARNKKRPTLTPAAEEEDEDKQPAKFKRTKLYHPLPATARAASTVTKVKAPLTLGTDAVVEVATLFKSAGEPVYLVRMRTPEMLMGRVVRPLPKIDTPAIDEIKHRLGMPSGLGKACGEWLVSLDLGRGGPESAAVNAHRHITTGVRTVRAPDCGSISIDQAFVGLLNSRLFWRELTTALLWRLVLGCGHTTSDNLLWLPAQQRIGSVGETAFCGGMFFAPASLRDWWTVRPHASILIGLQDYWDSGGRAEQKAKLASWTSNEGSSVIGGGRLLYRCDALNSAI